MNFVNYQQALTIKALNSNLSIFLCLNLEYHRLAQWLLPSYQVEQIWHVDWCSVIIATISVKYPIYLSAYSCILSTVITLIV